MSKRPHSRFDCSPGCAVEATVSLIDGKWKCVILYILLERTQRYSEIRRRIPTVTHRTLTNQLRELESDGLISRETFAEVPPRVEYTLTPRGRSLEAILQALRVWGDQHMDLFSPARRTAAAAD